MTAGMPAGMTAGMTADTLRCEVAAPPGPERGAAVVASVRDVTKLRGELCFVAPGSLPAHGRVIDGLRGHR